MKLPSKKKEIDRHDNMNYWKIIIKEIINWFPFLNIMEYTSDRIETGIILLPPLLNFFSMFPMRFWYDKEPVDQNDVKVIARRCSICGK